MESLSRKQHLDSARQSSFQGLTLNNVSSTSKPSGALNAKTSFLSYGEVVSANFRTTMVSTSSTPTPSTQTSPFYLLRDDARKLFNKAVFSVCGLITFRLFLVSNLSV